MNEPAESIPTYRILLLEDGPEDLTLYKRLLERTTHARFEVTEAMSVAEAKNIVQNNNFDCYVVDYHLPDADGIEFIAFLTSDPRRLKGAAIVMVTGQGSEEIAVEALKLGADDYITKKNISDGIFVRPLLNAIERAQLTSKILHYQNELERSNKELSDFTHTASHDLKAPLRRISAFCDILESDAAERLNEDDRKILERMKVNTARMQQLIDGLLSYSLIQYEKEEKEAVDLHALVEEIIEDFEPQIKECGADIALGNLPVMLVYPLRMRQLFSNLVSNALKYTRKNQPFIRIEGKPQGESCVFSVQDNGQGIPPEFQEEIFRDFKRLHSNEDVEGTGLGLPICRKIVQMHGGRIWVESTPGEGSTFYFTISHASVA